jgi:peptidylprolyl isomerase
MREAYHPSLVRISLLSVVLLVPALLGACGSKAPSASSLGGSPSAVLDQRASPIGTRPTVTIPDGPPPPRLVITDLKVGTGAEAVAGKSVTVQYVGVAWSTGKEFDASWDTGQPLPFVLGTGQVIPGWDRGVVGMRVGGRRQLTIPPDLAYGAAGSPPAIGPNETLVFVIDLVSVQ